MKIKNNIKNNKAFTLIETLVAITILMIAIAGPLTIANKGYTNSLDAKNQSIALNLAQEVIEYISFIKDNRLWGGWVPGTSFSGTVNQEFANCINSPCTFASIDVPADIKILPDQFTRTFYFEENNTDQILLHVNVSWNTGNLNGSINFEQIFTPYVR